MRTARRAAAVTGPAIRRITLALPATTLLGVLIAPHAAAHTTLVKAVPAAGSVVPAPTRIQLTYADPVRFTSVVVLDKQGHHHESGRSTAVDNTVTQQIAGRLSPGPYTVGWRVVAPDGHPATGEYRFTVAGAAVSGAASSGPVAAANRPAASPVIQQTARSGAGWWWVALIVAIAATAAGGLTLVRRRR